MNRPFRDEDREKTIVTSEGHSVGRIRDVEADRATIDRPEGDSLTEEIKEMLGWGDDDDTHELSREHIDRDEDDRLILRRHR